MGRPQFDTRVNSKRNIYFQSRDQPKLPTHHPSVSIFVDTRIEISRNSKRNIYPLDPVTNQNTLPTPTAGKVSSSSRGGLRLTKVHRGVQLIKVHIGTYVCRWGNRGVYVSLKFTTNTCRSPWANKFAFLLMIMYHTFMHKLLPCRNLIGISTLIPFNAFISASSTCP